MKKEDMRNNNVTEDNANRKLPIIIGIVVAAVLVIAIIAIVFITSSAKTSQPEVSTAPSVTEEPVPILDENIGVEADIQPKSTEQETEVENFEVKETPNQWFESLKLVEPTVAIWNDDTNTKMILVNDQKYELQKEDKIFYYFVAEWDNLKINPRELIESTPITGNYMEIQTAFKGEKTFKFEVTVNGVEYENNFTLVAATTEASEIKTDGSGEEWIESMKEQISVPSVFIWNDITGTKFVVEEQGEYEVREGTKISYFIPEGFKFKGMYPYEVFANFKGSKYEYEIEPAMDKISGSQECYVEWDENGETKSLTFTLITPTE